MTSLLQSANGAMDDETLGRVICAIKGVEFDRAWLSDNQDEVSTYIVRGKDGAILFSGYRDAAPDQSIDAALALLRERWPDMSCQLDYSKQDSCTAAIKITTSGMWQASYRQDTHLPLAILAAALKSLEPGGER